jgi:hypothetical protein
VLGAGKKPSVLGGAQALAPTPVAAAGVLLCEESCAVPLPTVATGALLVYTPSFTDPLLQACSLAKRRCSAAGRPALVNYAARSALAPHPQSYKLPTPECSESVEPPTPQCSVSVELPTPQCSQSVNQAGNGGRYPCAEERGPAAEHLRGPARWGTYCGKCLAGWPAGWLGGWVVGWLTHNTPHG